MNEISDRVTQIENRVAELKDWKRKYEDDEQKWKREKKGLLEQAGESEKLRDVLRQFLDLNHMPAHVATTETVNLLQKELVVNLTHEEKETNMTTGTVVGKTLFCALTDLPREGFSEAELSGSLKEHGWNVGHSTLAPTLGNLVRDGYLIKLEGKPAKYRLPDQVKLNAEILKHEARSDRSPT